MSSLTALEQYQRVTANYWAFTLTDGALRMLVVFHFHQLGYTCLLYTSPSPRDRQKSRMPSSA